MSPFYRVWGKRGFHNCTQGQGIRRESGRVSNRYTGGSEGVRTCRRESGGSPDVSDRRESGGSPGVSEGVRRCRRESGGSPCRRESGESPEEVPICRRESGGSPCLRESGLSPEGVLRFSSNVSMASNFCSNLFEIMPGHYVCSNLQLSVLMTE